MKTNVTRRPEKAGLRIRRAARLCGSRTVRSDGRSPEVMLRAKAMGDYVRFKSTISRAAE